MFTVSEASKNAFKHQLKKILAGMGVSFFFVIGVYYPQEAPPILSLSIGVACYFYGALLFNASKS